MRKGFKRLVVILISCLAVYSWLGFLLIPSVTLHVINQQLSLYANTPAHLQRLELNPFSFELNAWGFHLGDSNNHQASLQHLYGKFAYDSLWTQRLHLDNVELVQPQAQVIFDKNGEFNLTQLFNLPQSSKPAESTANTPLIVLIDRIYLQQGSARFNDQRQQDTVDVTFANLDITLNNFDTSPSTRSTLQLTAQANDGTQLHWQGDISMSPLSSSGHVQLTDAKLKSWWPYVREHFSAQLTDGRINLDTRYTLELSPTLQFTANQLSAKLSNLALNQQQQQPLLRLAQLSISDSSFDLTKQRLIIGKTHSSKLEAWAQIDKSGVLNWQKLLPTADSPSSNNAALAHSKQSSNHSAWRISVKQADFQQQQLHLADLSQSQPVALELHNLNLQVKDFDSTAGSRFLVELDSQIGEQGKISSSASVSLQPLNVDMTLNTSDLDLRPAQAWISPYAHVELRSALLSSAVKLQINQAEDLQLSLQGNAAINQLHLRDSLRSRDLLKWQTVDIEGINYNLQQQQLFMSKLALQQPYVRFIINENLTTNISELLIDQLQTTANQAENIKPEFALQIGGIDIKDGSANFADFSLTPNFATAIQQLNGQIGTLDSTSNKPTTVDIKGNVDRYAPVTIKGHLIANDPLKNLDIATSFKHLELTTLTPYSGKFAGYRIQKGRLNLDLHYKITDGKLNASNSLLLEQLQLGERVDSPDAVDLPVRLAIALLKDSKGRIKLDLPVQGDLNNPEFKVAPIVWKTLRNLITRAVSAPFNMLAGLVNKDAKELQEIAFAPGEFTLNASIAESLDTLAQGLQKRPQLRLEIEGGSRADLDAEPLSQMRLSAAYQNAWYSILQRRGSKIEANKEDLIVPDGEKPALLEGIYRTQLKQQPPAEWAQLNKQEREQHMRTAVLDSYQHSILGLRRLAQARANSIKEYLIEQAQLDPERVYLLDVSEGKTNAKQQVISTLHLGSM